MNSFPKSELQQLDKLTRLFSIVNAQKIIDRYIKNKPCDEKCILISVNIDKIPLINELFGHMFGDAVLRDVADIFRKKAAGTDSIISRVNGVEFIIFIKNCHMDYAEKLSAQISQDICNIYVGEDSKLCVSCSIGICDTDMGKTYDEIFEKAQQAMYAVMRAGGNAFISFDKIDTLKPLNENSQSNQIVNPQTSENGGEKEEDIVLFAFDILEKTRDLRSAINILISRVGREYGFDRISIFETNLEFFRNTITYQWDKQNHTIKQHASMTVTNDEINKFIGCFDFSGFFEVHSGDKMLETFDKNDQLFYAIYDGGTLKGAVVFEDDGKQRDKTTKAVLHEISKIISTYINKKNADIASKAKTEFLSRMSHEIRTPMNAITGMVTIAKGVVDDSQKTLECLNKIEMSTHYLLSLINDILDMSRIESGKMRVNYEPFNLDEFITGLSVLVKPQADIKHITFEILKNYKDTELIGDVLRLNQVLVNIIGNAVKFTPENGKVTLKIEQLVQEKDFVNIRFSVKDTGIGIRQDNITKIFQAFEQAEDNTAKRFGGTGLGLAISSNLVLLMGGILEVKSKEGVGSEFYFSLNMKKCTKSVATTDDSDINCDAQDKENDGYDFSGKRVLLVEDNKLNSEIATTILEMAKLQVENAYDGKQAVDMFNSSQVNYYDAILMDVRMPVMDGLEATHKIRLLEKDDAKTVPIIAMTANAFDEDSRKSIDCGMNGHLSKPIDTEKLFRALNQAVNKSHKRIKIT